MGRRDAKLGPRQGKRPVGRNLPRVVLDEHEGLSVNQVKVILREFGLLDKFDEFNDWMFGQTCPIIKRGGEYGVWKEVFGVYEYDLFRWIEAKKKGTAPVWD